MGDEMHKSRVFKIGLVLLIAMPAGYGQVACPVADKLYTEYPEPNEAENAARVKAAVKTAMQYSSANGSKTLRDTHAKAHGCAKATFSVNEDVPEKYKVGLFSEPKSYKAWVRFANGRATVEADSVEDTRSMAVKVIGVEGERLTDAMEARTQDIITQNAPAFFIRSIAQYADFFEHVIKGKDAVKAWFMDPIHVHEALTLKQMTSRVPGSLLEEKYWSGSAFQLGMPPNHIAVKYALLPCSVSTVKAPDPLPATYYRDELVSHLATSGACWNIALQEQTSKDMPIDDVTCEWSEKESPFVPVGRLTMEPQDIDAPAQDDFCENLSFYPWNARVEHRPIGALNRLRKEIYPMVSTFRHKQNGVKPSEITGDEVFSEK